MASTTGLDPHPATTPGSQRSSSRDDGVLGVAVPDTVALRFADIPGAPFGVEVAGVDWAAARDGTTDEVRLITVALRRHQLLVLRGQRTPDEAELDAFLRAFGRLVLETEDGAAHYAGHLDRSGPASQMAVDSWQYMERAQDNSGSTRYDPGTAGMSELIWHNDQSHRPMLKVLSVFEALDVEDDVVPTEFRDTYTAYECLSPERRAPLDGCRLVYFNPRLPGPDELPRLADATHPVFLAHPHTGRRALYVNGFADRIVGMNRAESDEVLAGLRAHLDATAPRYVHRWRTGDLVMWDNIGLQHRRDAVPAGQRRVMRQHGGLAE